MANPITRNGASHQLQDRLNEPKTVEALLWLLDRVETIESLIEQGPGMAAMFDYDKTPQESFPFDQSQERYSMYRLKKYALPRFYWHGMLRGRM